MWNCVTYTTISRIVLWTHMNTFDSRMFYCLFYVLLCMFFCVCFSHFVLRRFECALCTNFININLFSKLAPKSFVDPRLCLVVHNHYCAQPFIGIPATRLTGITVNPGIARSHHYRKCLPTFNKQTCSNYFKSQTRDDVMLRFKEQLRENVRLVLTDIAYEYETV